MFNFLLETISVVFLVPNGQILTIRQILALPDIMSNIKFVDV